MNSNASALQQLLDAGAAGNQELVYPPREVAKEREHLHTEDARSFDALSHFGWGGRRDLRAGARILIVGEGNGDATVQFAEQARDTAIEIVAIDISDAAISTSKARLAQRGLTNVVHHSLSLLDLPQAGLGEFDIIECSHVLDSMEDPQAGIEALGAVLKDDGLLLLTVNATYGRLQLYMLQALMKHLVNDFMPRELKIQIVREFLSSVPADHWLGHDSADIIKELDRADGTGIEALVLQPYNHSFTVAELYPWLDGAGLSITSFMGARRAEYQIEAHTQSQEWHDLLLHRPRYEQEVIADLMGAGLREHQLYVSIEEKQPAAFAPDMVIAFAPSVANGDALKDKAPESPLRDGLLAAIDGKRTVAQLLAETGAGSEELEALFNALLLHQLAFLRHESVTPYLTYTQIAERLTSIAPIIYQ